MNHNEEMDSAIAIVGMSGRFPGSPDIAHFWQSLLDGVEGIAQLSEDELLDAGIPLSAIRNPNYVKAGSYLDDIELFDAGFFGISPREAEVIDPQHRLFLEHAWLALNEAGVIREDYDKQVAVFGGASFSTYGLLNLRPEGGQVGSLETVLGNDKDYLATRVSYKLGLKGPSVSVQTACSTSLTAVAMACDSLLNYQCDVALAGGVTVKLPKKAGYLYEEGSILSPDGHCRTFDARAKGTVFGSGVGVVALKRLEDALADGDIIHAVIRGTGINNDGDHKVGFTAPSVEGQARVIAAALAAADVSADTIGYVEAHGTATPLGDPIEVRALSQAFRAQTPRTGYCGIGSVKTNVGHLESAAGITGLIKAVLAVKHGVIPPSLHFETPNPEIDFENSPFRVVDRLTPWPETNYPRRAGVNSFGMGGTNVHVIVEEPPARPARPAGTDRSRHILPLSAKSEPALRELARAYADRLAGQKDLALGDVGFTAATARMHFPHRLAVSGKSHDEIASALRRFVDGDTEGIAQSAVRTERRPEVAFLFSGQGSQWAGMGRDLCETQPRFREVLERCDALLRPHLPRPLHSVMFAQEGEERLLDETLYTQPALFSLEYALADLWRSWGVEPAAVLGHSVGEYAAAAFAGVFSLEDGLRLIAARARLMQALPQNGAMMTIFAHEEEVRAAVADYAKDLSIAALNGPASTVISGGRASVEAVAAAFQARGVKVRPLTVSHAFHSPLMQPMLDEFRTVAEGIRYRAPTIPVVSNVTGRLETEALAHADYWCRHVMAPVRFMDGIEALRARNLDIFLEIGPRPVLCSLGREAVATRSPSDRSQWLTSLNRTSGDWKWMLESLAHLYAAGMSVDWKAFDSPYHRQRVELPGYAFQRKRYWLDLQPGRGEAEPVRRRSSGDHPLLGERLRQAGTREIRFETVLSARHPAYLADHKVFETAVLPATAYLEMAVAAGRALLKTDLLDLEDVSFRQTMTLPEGEERIVQLVLVPEGQATYHFQVFSEAGEGEDWLLHCSGRLKAGADEDAERLDIAATAARCDMAVPIPSIYENYRTRGLDYGPIFQGILELSGGEGEALARLRLPAAACDGTERHYILHPALMDACFQALGAVLGAVDDRETYLPVGLERLRIRARLPEEIWNHAWLDQREDAAKDAHFASLRLHAGDGGLLLAAEGLQSRRVNREVVLRQDAEPIESSLYDLAWRSQPLASSVQKDTNGTWLVIADESGLGERLAARLDGEGQHCRVIPFQAGERDVAAWTALLGEERALAHIVYLKGLAPAGDETEAVAGRAHTLARDLLRLTQAVVSDGRLGPLFVVTRGAQGGVAEAAATDVAASPLWGFVRSVWHEYPTLPIACIDLDPATSAEDDALLLSECRSAGEELQVAYRGGERYVARLVAHERAKAAHTRLAIPEGPYRIGISPDGDLEGLQVVPLSRRRPDAGEVEVEVRGMGLNFRDVLNVMGLYPGDAGPLGGECSGRVVRVGLNVTDVAVGDEVVVMHYGTFASYVTVPEAVVFKVPKGLSTVEAAGLPIVYLTTWYGLHHIANIRRGDRILIHSAAGGVGIAAIRIAQWAGAEIFATASESKHDFLHSLGIAHVMNSRTVDFAERVAELTNGEGVDIVLNSLTGEAIPASLACVARNGRFIEIGKRDVWPPEQVAAMRPDILYHIVNFDIVAVEQPQLVRDLLNEALSLLGSGDLGKPLTTVYPVEEAVDAMALMQKARHIGKIVLSVPEPGQRSSRVAIRPAVSYLVTGGLGGLGLLVARWLVERGARHVILLSRRHPDADAQASIAALEAKGAAIHVRTADVTDAAALEAIIDGLDEDGTPLRGVIHAAGILDDGVLSALTGERLDRVLAPKVDGAWALHRATAERPLDFFVMFSSLGSVLGAPGQANYAAANAFLDTLAHWRTAHGLPALTVNWGGWSETGMTTGAAVASRLEGRGTIAPERGLQILERLMEEGITQAGVVPFRWSDYFEGLPRSLPLFEDIERRIRQEAAQVEEFAVLRQQIAAAEGAARDELIGTYLQSLLVRLLRLDPGEVEDRARPLAELGLDSLVSIQLRNRIRSELGLDLPVGSLMEAASVNALILALGAQFEGAMGGETLPALQRLGRSEAPLSFAQQRLFFMATLDPNSAFYTVTFSLFLEGPLDPQAFRQAVEMIAQRHESLRTVFPVTDGEPVQRILPEIADAFSVEDLSALDPVARESAVKRIVDAEARRTFDLESGPLFHVTLVRLEGELHRAIISWHHIITDGWSAVVFIQEVGALYRVLRAGETPSLPELPIQYADFALWQREWLTGERLDSQVAYWKAKLAAPLPTLNLPADRERSAASDHRGGAFTTMVAPDIARGLKDLARREGVTLFTVMMAAFKALLLRVSGEEDVAVGSLVANRVRPEVEGLIGFFANMMVFRTHLGGNPTFRELVAREGATVRDALAHQDVPFEKLVEDIRPERQPGRNPLTDVIFVLHRGVPADNLSAGGVRIGPMWDVDNGTVRFDLEVHLWDTEQGISASFVYNADLFDPGTVERLERQFETLLDGIVRYADSPILELPLLDGKDAPSAEPDDPILAETLASLEGLSEEEVDALLQDMLRADVGGER